MPRRAACDAPRAPAAAERRLVSVLFVDLVGFTAASEGRDAEDTRELLSRYFDVARTVIERYGGTVEKFIGDAVMAVWGAPVAQEDDAERAVRAALDLAAAIPEIDPLLRARAGILTGEAAVTLGATNQGMVAGDLVNTASRIQSAAEPGTVLTGEATKRATEATIAYEDAGVHEMKGKTEPVQLWRALRVVAGRGGAMRSAGLEAPFVGRNRELQLVKDLFHASEEERRAQLVLVSGIAGIGKSRLAWEFEKYIDGLAADDVLAPRPLPLLRRGRRLLGARRDGADALRDRSRTRMRRLPARSSTQTLEEHLPDAEERRWVRPRIAHLLGLEDGIPGDEENLFSAWRILFERLAEQDPTVLALRGRAVGRCGPARLHRVPARLVAQPAALRVRARPARVRREALDVGRQARLHAALPRAAAGLGDERAPHRPRARPAGRSARPRARAGRGRAALRRRDGAHAARPGPPDAATAPSTGRPGRSTSSRCPRPCRRSSPPASTA